MEFFNRLYMLVGIIPYNENPLELTVFSNILIKVKNITENIELRLNYSYNLTSWNRGWHFHISNNEEQEMLLIEKEVKNWIIQFLKKTKQEWNFSLKKEKIKDRNIRLLNEIEDLLLKKKLI
jgi:hypothetical protein